MGSRKKNSQLIVETVKKAVYTCTMRFLIDPILKSVRGITKLKKAWAILMMMGLCHSCATNPATGKKMLLLTSEGQENSQGEEAYREIIKSERPLQDQVLSRRIEIIGQRLAAVSGKKDYRWEFRTFQNNTPNAFCLPGGKVGVYTGILGYAKNDAGLAAVLGHEIGHALARHGGQRMSQHMVVGLGSAALAITALSKMPAQKKTLAMAALGLGTSVGILLPFSRSHETEADEIGLKLMALAGYDPSEAIEFWDRFSKASGKSPPEFLSTHPNSAKRRDHLRELLPEAQNIYQNIAHKHGKGLEF